MLGAIKSFFGGLSQVWQPIGRRPGGAAFSPFAAYDDDPPPGLYDLLTAYEEVVYSCVNLISHNIGSIDLKLCVATSSDDPRPTHPTRSLSFQEAKRLRSRSALARKSLGVEEVVSHPLLDLLERPNPRQSGSQLLAATSAVLELCGQAFWFIGRSGTYPAELWLLPTPSITPEINERGEVTAFVQDKGQSSEERLAPDDVIWFRSFNPVDPYNGAGVSPVQSVWRRVMIGRKESLSWSAVLNNMAYPSALIFPPDGQGFTQQQANRIAKEFQQRFGLGRQGGVWVVQDPLKYQAVSTPPKDVSALQLFDQVKTSICNAYAVPRPLLDMQDSNFASADTARRAFQEFCLLPRIGLLLEEINRHLVSKLNPRLFLDAGEVVMPDKSFELQRTTSLVTSNIATINEARQAQGLEPRPGLDVLLVQLQPQVYAPPSGPAVRALPAAQKSLDLVAGQLAGVLRDVFQRLKQETLQKLATALDGKELALEVKASKAWIDLGNWTDIIARLCSPFIRLSMTEGAESILTQFGGDTTMRLAAIPKLDQAVGNAVLAFAQSTLDTTSLAVADAVTQTRQALRDGMSRGEANRTLAERVEQIFQGLSETRAYLVADTESNRARHEGELLMAREFRDTGGVTVQKRWLCDALACPECRVLNGLVRGLDEPFIVTAPGVYGTIQAPPYHPGCRCTQVFVTQ